MRLQILFNVHTTTGLNFKNPKPLMEALARIKQTSQQDLQNFLAKDHRSFTVLSVSFKQIESTQRAHIILSKKQCQKFLFKR